jgi:signal peptidase I
MMTEAKEEKNREKTKKETSGRTPEAKFRPVKKNYKKAFGYIWSWVKDIFIAFIIVLGLYTYVFQFSQIRGNSMYPTLKDGERVFVEKVTGWVGEFKRGDIITLKYPQDPSVSFVKRIIAFEDETISIRGGVVFIDGIPLRENYIQNAETFAEMQPVTVPKGYLFVMGDNRPASSDSRRWGFLPKDYAYGRVLFIFWPPNCIGGID